MTLGRARYLSACPICHKRIRLGEVIEIDHDGGTPSVHRDCARERERRHEEKRKREAERARRLAEQAALEILERAGESAGTWWDWTPLRDAANLGFVAQWSDVRGHRHALERYRLPDGAEAYVEQITTSSGRRLDPVLHAPRRILLQAWAEHVEWLRTVDKASLEHWLGLARSGANPDARPMLEYAMLVLEQSAPPPAPPAPPPAPPAPPAAQFGFSPEAMAAAEQFFSTYRENLQAASLPAIVPQPQPPVAPIQPVEQEQEPVPPPRARHHLRREPAEPVLQPAPPAPTLEPPPPPEPVIPFMPPVPVPFPPAPAFSLKVPLPGAPPQEAPVLERVAAPAPMPPPAPMPVADPLFAQRARKPASLGADVTIDLHPQSGLLWVKLPKEADAARGALKGAGWYFHFGAGDMRCYKKCMACKAFLPDNVWFTRRTAIAAPFVGYMTPQARQAVEGQRKAMEESRAADAEIELPCPQGRAYLPFQRAGIKWGLERESVLISDEMGLGKSVEALGIVNADPSVHRTLVISPASLVLNWRDEARKWLVRDTLVVPLETAADIPTDTTKDWLLITNYEKLILQRGKGLGDALLAQHWDAVVVDEAHRLANPDSAKSARAIVGSMPAIKMVGDDEEPDSEPREPGLLGAVRRKILLTGTPFRERVRDMYPLLRTLDPVTFGSVPAFLMRYCDAKTESVAGRKRAWKVDGASNLDELQDKLRGEALGGRGLMIRRLKADVLPELPPKRRMIVPLAVDTRTASLLREEKSAGAMSMAQIEGLAAQADMCALRGLSEEYEEAVRKLDGAQEVSFATFSRQRHDVGLAKVPAAIDHISGLLDDGLEALVVYAHHQDVVDALADGLTRFNAARYTGRETLSEKHAAVRSFQTPSSPCRVLVASIQAAREGITLTRAHVEIFVELSPSMVDMIQAEDRCHRIGQDNSVLIQHLVHDGSLDQRLCEILVSKMRVAEKVLDGKAAAAPKPPSYPDEIKREALTAIQSLEETRLPEWAGVVAWLASLSQLTDVQVEIALRCLRCHATQLQANVRTALGIEAPKQPKTEGSAIGRKKPVARKVAKKPAKAARKPKKTSVPAVHT